MDESLQKKVEIPYTPCPPEEFAGRFTEKERLLEILSKARHQGQVALISGAPGSGKSSLLNWAEYEIQNRPGGLESPAIKKDFLETPGMIFAAYKGLLTELKGHQKLGWFKKALVSSRMRKSIDLTLSVLESMSSMAGPVEFGIKAATTVTRGLLPAQESGYYHLLSSFLSVLRNVSGELKENRLLVLICDDAQRSSGPDFKLLKDLIRNLPYLPQGIAFIVSLSLEKQTMERYYDLQKVLDMCGYEEIRLSGMTVEEITDFAERRFGISVDEQAAEFLRNKIGDPFSLVRCFNLLRVHNLKPNLGNIETTIPEAVEKVRSIYRELDPQWQDRINCLCILDPPLELDLIACVLDVAKARDITRLKDELNDSAVFRRLDNETYDFAHPSLREYRLKELPQRARTELNARAVRCYESLREGLSGCDK